ncbi:MAG TPA: hypothetical protein VH054_14000 [Polyangiaceae bacterium]|jgi:hypothetical protein|nr:hypothetical protein [Polyangiaceae bacterium]
MKHMTSPSIAKAAVLAALLLGALPGCRAKKEMLPASELASSKKEYAGEWEGGDVKLHIGTDGSVVYQRGAFSTPRQTIDHFEGDDIHFDDRIHFTVGSVPSARLRVESPPTESAGAWTMQIEHTTVTRKVFGGSKLAATIDADLRAKGASFDTVTCATSTSGGAFDCALKTKDGGSLPIHCTYDLDWETHWILDAAHVNGHGAEGLIASKLRDAGRIATVACPSDVLMPFGGSFQCTITEADSVDVPIQVEIPANRGALRFTLPAPRTASAAPTETKNSKKSPSKKKSEAFDPLGYGRRS